MYRRKILSILSRVKKVVPLSVKKIVKRTLLSNHNDDNNNKKVQYNLQINEIVVDNEVISLFFSDNFKINISRLCILISGTHKLLDISFKQVENCIILNTSELNGFGVVGKHVFRIFYRNDNHAYTMQLPEDKSTNKYSLSQVNDEHFLFLYTNINGNLTLEVASKSTRKSAPKHIQGYLDGQFESIKPNVALFEANHGKTNSGNMFYLAIELSKRANYKVFWASKTPAAAERTFEFYGIKNIDVIPHLSYEYGNIIATSELLFSDNTFYPFFSKRDGQKYINTWHGTPLKTLGKDIKGEETSFGNIVKNILQVDNMYFSNKYTAEKHLKSLDLQGVLKTNVYIAPSPRNSSFFNKSHVQQIKESEGLQNKKVFVYLPTYRGKSSNANNESSEKIEELLSRFVSTLPSEYVIYYKLHPIDTQNLQISSSDDRIRKIPDYYELYDFLSVTDGLISDYSSIMFDYALSKKPIYLYTYDQEEYFKDRGTYIDIDELPFKQFNDVDTLLQDILVNEVNTVDLSNFIQTFAPFDNANGAKEIIDHVIYGTQIPDIANYNAYNGKPNVYIMGGSLWANGVTAALKNLIDNVDLDKRNYILLVDSNNFKEKDIARYLFFDKRIRVYPYKGYAIRSNFEDSLVKKFENGQDISSSEHFFLQQSIDREIKRIFGSTLLPDYFIHFSGYEIKFAEFIIFMKTIKTVMYVHNDMFKEYASRKNFNPNVIFEAYRSSDKVVLVNEKLQDNFVRHFPELSNTVHIADNFIGYKNIKEIENDSLAGTLLNTTFQFSEGSQGDGNPLAALKLRIQNGSQNEEKRFLKINNIFNQLNDTVDGIVRNAYLKINNDSVLKSILLKGYFEQQYKDFYNQFGYDENFKSLVEGLLFPKAIEEYRKDILPYTLKNQQRIYELLQNERPEKINNSIESIRNIYNIFGLRKLEVIEELFDPDIKIFINIARFDKQKRLDRLIFAFEQIFEKNPNTRLFLVASHGSEKRFIIELVKKSIARHAIRIFGAMDNPYPLLKKCDCFVFTSDYEALGLVVYEALAVGIPVITTNLKTTMKNLTQEQVYPVPFTVDGVYKGMEQFLLGKISQIPFDFEKYNYRSIKKFESIFD